MPITFKTASHDATKYRGTRSMVDAEFFKHLPSRQQPTTKVVASNFSPNDDVVFQKNGFVNTVLRAYDDHYNLHIRPDDVWIAIICQLSFHINRRAETLRKHFVSHEGKRRLTIQIPPSTLEGINWESVAKEFTDALHENLNDKELKSWIIPEFTTTTSHDKTVSAILFMASMKEYFSYGAEMACGIPEVTLDGTRGDWEKILRKLDKLKEWGDETEYWAKMLAPIISKFIACFEGKIDHDFWGHVIHWKRQDSGSDYLWGWITAFCVFSEQGYFGGRSGGGKYVLNGVTYPMLKRNQIPTGIAQVDVDIDEGGRMSRRTVVFAGNMGMKVTEGRQGDTVQNVPIWVCCLKE